MGKLHDAVRQGDLEEVKKLLKGWFGPSVNQSDGGTALWYAAKYNQLHILKYLVEEAKAGFSDASSALEEAIKSGFLSIVEYLLNCRVHASANSLIAAVNANHLNVVKLLVTKININEYDGCGFESKYVNAIFHAVFNNNLPMVRCLAEDGKADLNYRLNRKVLSSLYHHRPDSDGHYYPDYRMYGATPLLLAAAKGHLSIVKYLVETCQVDLNQKCGEEESFLSSISNFFSGENELTGRMANQGKTALLLAISYGHLPVIKYLVEVCRVKLDQLEGENISGLMKECHDQENRKDIVAYLYHLQSKQKANRDIFIQQSTSRRYAPDKRLSKPLAYDGMDKNLIKLQTTYNYIKYGAVLPNGWFIILTEHATIEIWDLNTNKKIKSLGDFFDSYLSNTTQSVLLLQDNHLAVIGNVSKTIKIWNLENGKLIRTFDDHFFNILDVCQLFTGRLAIALADGSIIIRDIETGDIIKELEYGHIGEGKGCRAIKLQEAPNQWLISQSNKFLRFWDTKTGKLIRNITLPDSRSFLVSAIFPNNCFAIISKGKMKILELETEREKVLSHYNFYIDDHSIPIVLPSKHVVTFGKSQKSKETDSGAYMVWDIDNETVIKIIPTDSHVMACGVLPNGCIFESDLEKNIKIKDLISDSLINNIPLPSRLSDEKNDTQTAFGYIIVTPINTSLNLTERAARNAFYYLPLFRYEIAEKDLSGFEQLQYLSQHPILLLENNKLRIEQVPELFSKDLEYLDVSCTYITDVLMEEILRQCPQLKEIKYERCGWLTNKGIALIESQLAKFKPKANWWAEASKAGATHNTQSNTNQTGIKATISSAKSTSSASVTSNATNVASSKSTTASLVNTIPAPPPAPPPLAPQSSSTTLAVNSCPYPYYYHDPFVKINTAPAKTPEPPKIINNNAPIKAYNSFPQTTTENTTTTDPSTFASASPNSNNNANNNQNSFISQAHLKKHSKFLGALSQSNLKALETLEKQGVNLEKLMPTLTTLQTQQQDLAKRLEDVEVYAGLDAKTQTAIACIQKNENMNRYYQVIKTLLGQTFFAAKVIASGEVDASSSMSTTVANGISNVAGALCPPAAPFLSFAAAVVGVADGMLSFKAMQRLSKWIDLENMEKFARDVAIQLTLAQEYHLNSSPKKDSKDRLKKIMDKCIAIVRAIQFGESLTNAEILALLDADKLLTHMKENPKPPDSSAQDCVEILFTVIMGKNYQYDAHNLVTRRAFVTMYANANATLTNNITEDKASQHEVDKLTKEIAAVKKELAHVKSQQSSLDLDEIINNDGTVNAKRQCLKAKRKSINQTTGPEVLQRLEALEETVSKLASIISEQQEQQGIRQNNLTSAEKQKNKEEREALLGSYSM